MKDDRFDMTMGVRKGDKVHGPDRDPYKSPLCIFCGVPYENDGNRLIEFAGTVRMKAGYAHESCLREVMDECMSALGEL